MKQIRLSLLVGLTCLSAASVLLSNVWLEVVPGTLDQYTRGCQPTWIVLRAVWVNLTILSVLLGFTYMLGQRNQRLRYLGIPLGLLVLLAAVDPVRRVARGLGSGLDILPVLAGLGRAPLAVLIALVIVGSVIVALKWRRSFEKLIVSLFIALSLLPFIFTVHLLSHIRESEGQQKSLPSHGTSRPLKVIVLIFDEMDYEWTFLQRPAHIAIPEITRLLEGATQYTHVFPPGSDTLWSVPSILSGKRYGDAVVDQGGELVFKDSVSGAWTPLAALHDVFNVAGDAGWNSYYLQWRVFLDAEYSARRPGLTVSHYDTDPRYVEARVAHREFFSSLKRQWVALSKSYTGLLAAFVPPNPTASLAALAVQMDNELTTTLAMGKSELIVGHLPFPHPPAIIDPRSGQMLRELTPHSHPVNNLALVDRTIGRVRRMLSERYLWDDVLLIITSDHWLRGAAFNTPDKTSRDTGYRVPLIVKFPNQNTPRTVNTTTMNTIVYDLISRRVAGIVDTPDTTTEIIHPFPGNVVALLSAPHSWCCGPTWTRKD